MNKMVKSKGTIGLIHKGCLEKWLDSSKLHQCEICGFEYQIEYIYPKFSEVSENVVAFYTNQITFLIDRSY